MAARSSTSGAGAGRGTRGNARARAGTGARSSGTGLLGKLILYPLALLGAAQIGWQGYRAWSGQGIALPPSLTEGREEERARPSTSGRANAARGNPVRGTAGAGNVPDASELRRPRGKEGSGERKPEAPPAGGTPQVREPMGAAPVPAAGEPGGDGGGAPDLLPRSTAPADDARPETRPALPPVLEAPPRRRSQDRPPELTGSAGSEESPVTVRPAARPRPVPAAEVSRGISGRPEVALTFDAGADYRPARRILDTLQQEGVRCTFFLTGEWVQKNPRTTRRIVADGHEVGNHSWDHPPFTELSDAAILDQLRRTEAIIYETTGRSSRPYFRPPLGARDDRVRRVVAEDGYLTIYWTLDSLDSVQKGITATQIRERVLGRVQAGNIVLLHCGSQATADALPDILSGLRARGLVPVPVTRLLER